MFSVLKKHFDAESGQYAELEYIESSGSQWINTGIKASDALATEIKLQANLSYVSEYPLFGDAWSANAYFLMFYNSKVRFHFKGWYGDISTSLSDILTIATSNAKFKVNDSELAISNTSSFSTSNDIYLFKCNSNSKGGYFKLYSLKMTDGNLVRDFIPVKDEDGTVCLYDKVSKAFFYNQGTGNFIAGPEKGISIVSNNTKFLVSKENSDYYVPVSFNSNGADTISYSLKKYKIGETYSEFPTTTRSGYTFLGWYTEKSKKMNATDNVRYDIKSLIANWQESKMTELQYIESTGTQYIDTGINSYSTGKWIIKVGPLATRQRFIGCGSLDSDINYMQIATPNSVTNYIPYNYGGNWEDYSASIDITQDNNLIEYEFSNSSQSLKYNNNCIATSTHPYNSSAYPIRIFRSSVDSMSKYVKFYYAKLYQSTTLVRDFIPVKDENDVVCLYDKVSQQYFYNQGTGSFIAGPEAN